MAAFHPSYADALVYIHGDNVNSPKFTFHGKVGRYSVSNSYPRAVLDAWSSKPTYIATGPAISDINLSIHQSCDLADLFPHPDITPTMRALALAILSGDVVAALAAADAVQEAFLGS